MLSLFRLCCVFVSSDVIGVIAGAMKESFDPAWRRLFPAVLKYAAKSRSTQDQAMAIGVLAEVIRVS
jgi:hypothetical protein